MKRAIITHLDSLASQLKITSVPSFQCDHALKQIGAGLRTARQRRKESEAMAAQRVGISRATYQRLERGDPGISVASVIEALLVFGFEAQVLGLGHPDTDGVGIRLEHQRKKKD